MPVNSPAQDHFDAVVQACPFDWEMSTAITKSIFSKENLKGKRFLDAACGIVGKRDQYLKQEKNILEYTAVDLSFEALSASKKINAELSAVQADLCDMPFLDNSFD
ncbi:MAG TPA: class I SAM-dependent methyltransferase, partial [Candidatus Omnitrophota bacterium]|nr:class I SAM-dependent methyltransferase [Candidatus Omnitrophota bacterium]